MNQIDIFDIMRQPVQITKPIRLIELFAGYGSQQQYAALQAVWKQHRSGCDV